MSNFHCKVCNSATAWGSMCFDCARGIPEPSPAMSAMYNLAEDFRVTLEDNGIPKADMLKYLAGDGTDDTSDESNKLNTEAPKPKKYEYSIQVASDFETIIKYIDDALAKDWDCQGGISESYDQLNNMRLCQAMIREIKDD